MSYISYRKGYKYQLADDYHVKISISGKTVVQPWFILDIHGTLLIKAGYAWDGPSGPTFDTPSTMRCSLVHDVLYQMLRAGLLDKSYRETADNELYRLAIEDNMWKLRARLWLRELRKFGGPNADPKNKRRVYLAPKDKRSQK